VNVTAPSANTSIGHYLRSGDHITVGPSTKSGYAGRVGVGVCSVVSTFNIITLASALADVSGTPQFNSTDPITAIGTGIPAGWAGDCFGADPSTLVLNGHNIEGYDDVWYSLNFSKSASVDYDLIRLSAGIIGGSRALPPFEPSAVYFTSAHMKSGSLSGTITIDFLETSGAAVLGNIVLTHSASWVERTAVLPITGSLLTSGAGIEIDARNTSTCASLMIDCLAVCHAKGTDDAASGIYTFDEYPREGSFRYDYRNLGLASENANEHRSMLYPGGPDIKHVIRCQFESAGAALRNNLKVLELWQRRGNTLLLQPNQDGIPPYLYGNMFLFSQGRPTWDLTKGTIDFQFIEA
jgi:hypothetical protein